MDPERIPNRHAHSLSNLYHNLEKFDDLELIDNSSSDEIQHLPVPIYQCRFELGKPVDGMSGEKKHAAWVSQLLQRLERRLDPQSAVLDRFGEFLHRAHRVCPAPKGSTGCKVVRRDNGQAKSRYQAESRLEARNAHVGTAPI